jgi:hypothetical protein
MPPLMQTNAWDCGHWRERSLYLGGLDSARLFAAGPPSVRGRPRAECSAARQMQTLQQGRSNDFYW